MGQFWLASKNQAVQEKYRYQSAKEDEGVSFVGKFDKDISGLHFHSLDQVRTMDDVSARKLLVKEEWEDLKAKAHDVNYVYLIIKGHQLACPDGFRLQIGELLKLGRIKFFIREMSFLGQKERADSNQLFYKEDFNCYINGNVQSEGESLVCRDSQCRVCLSEECQEDNMLISICKCSGSVQYIHVNCIKQWLNSKLAIKEGKSSLCYNYRNFACELCMHPYPKSLYYKNLYDKPTTVELLEYSEQQAANYMILETLNKENNLTGALHILFFNEMGHTINIGRGSDSDVRISDISVSRVHTKIHLLQNGFYVTDNDSKFGTLVRVRETLTIPPSATEGLFVQYGRSIIGMGTNEKFNFSRILKHTKKESSQNKVETDTSKRINIVIEDANLLSNNVEEHLLED